MRAFLAAWRRQNRMPEPPGQRVTNHSVVIDQEDLHVERLLSTHRGRWPRIGIERYGEGLM